MYIKKKLSSKYIYIYYQLLQTFALIFLCVPDKPWTALVFPILTKIYFSTVLIYILTVFNEIT